MKFYCRFLQATLAAALLTAAGCKSMPTAYSSASPSDPIIMLSFDERGGWNWAPRMNITIWPDGRVDYISTNDIIKWVEWEPFVEATWTPDIQSKRLSDTEINHITSEISSICSNMPKRLAYQSPSGAVMIMVVVCGKHKYTLKNDDYTYLKGKPMGEKPYLKGWDMFASTWTRLYDVIEWAIENGEPVRSKDDNHK